MLHFSILTITELILIKRLDFIESETVAALEVLPQLMPGKMRTFVASKHAIDIREVIV